VNIGAFSAVWGNNPESDLATPEITRDMAKEDMIFEKLDQWIWSLRHDKPPTMAGIPSKLAMDSLARIYQASNPALPTIELPKKYERSLRRILALQKDIDACQAELKRYEEEVKAHSVRIAELMKEHEHGVLETTSDKLLIDFVTKSSKRVSSSELKKKYPVVYDEVVNTSNSRKLRVSSQPK